MGARHRLFTRSGGHWTQDKSLVGTGAVGKSAPSVALSADGSIVMVGGSNDNGGIGAAWMFTRSGGYWTEDKSLVGTGVAANAVPSASVDSSIVMVGRSNDNGGARERQRYSPAEAVAPILKNSRDHLLHLILR